ncbi:MAG: phytanoyl-CoA dioxygenase family protein [Pirellulaceae bacterium]|nr:phytanoyl-CoA dioxygenase family protein [Pirellulaceae bacterium]
MLNTQTKNFQKEGYCLFENVLTVKEIGAIRNELDHAIANLPEKLTVFKEGVDQEVDARPEYMTEPHPKNAFWMEVCRHPHVLDAVESVLGPNLILIMSHLIVKIPEAGLPVTWHQDNTYWPSVSGTEVATVWMAVDDTDVSNGCMQVIPCTHAGYPELEKVKTGKDDLLGLTVEVTEKMAAEAIPLEMKAGSLSIHDSFVLHGSEANTSGCRRAAYTMRYANANTVTIDTEAHWVPVYLVRGNGGANEKQYVDARPGCPVPEVSS